MNVCSSGNEHQSEFKRRRHHSGISVSDVEDIAEDFSYMELRNVVNVSNGTFSWSLDNKEAVLKEINLKIPMGK